jgi:hypothetical protein
MPTPDGQQFKLYHGTSGEIEGGVVNANPGAAGTGGYATSIKELAENYAMSAAERDNRLFGTVYEVGGYDDDSEVTPVPNPDSDIYMDPKGLRVKKEASFPLNRNIRRRWSD